MTESESTIIIDQFDSSWIPCIKFAQKRLIDVYATLHIKRADLNKAGLKIVFEKIENIKNNIKGVNGVYFQTDDRMVFSLNEWAQIFAFTRTAELLIGIEGYKNVWNIQNLNM